MTIREILRKTALEYKLSPLELEILLSLAMGKPKVYILAHPEKELEQSEYKKFISFAKRRCAGEPVAYISGKKEFYGLDFIVNKNVLIPRPETEVLVDYALKRIADTKYQPTDTIIDVGTGSGNIILSIIKNIPEYTRKKINYFAVDISRKALEVARENAKKHKVDKKTIFVHSNLLEYFLKNKIKLKNILVVANLPYVSSKLYNKNKSNLKFEPHDALLCGYEGLAVYRILFIQLKKMLAANHSLRASAFIEISPEQRLKISQIIGKILPNSRAKFYRDLAGKHRIVEIDA